MKSLTRKARFILSFDCEGKWGMADHPEMASSNPISRDSLANAYTQIFQILEKHNIPATFALVGLFAGASRTLAAKLMQSLDAWSARVAQRRADERLWAMAQSDARLMAELRGAIGRDDVALDPAQAHAAQIIRERLNYI